MRSGAERRARLGSDAVATVYNVGMRAEFAPPPLPSQSPVMRARWSNLVLLTYEAPEELLRRFIHPALELDRWNGRTHVSLVAFDFEDTRLFGYGIPGFANFPEVNLRTYVRFAGQRGVVFIRELVPSRVIAAVARIWYNEPYRRVALDSQVERSNGLIRTERRWSTAEGQLHRIRTMAEPPIELPKQSSVEHHFKEHEWGFGRSRDGRLLRYRVEHPVWPIHTLADISIGVRFAVAYGAEWAFLDEIQPMSTVFTVGSEVAVYPPFVVLEG